ncbi:MAG: 1-acyl-sn-glycerol-3-phosphate acyltransferase [Betaproteobacteria bacterium]|nr:MAG: 1-acyl-sn-glycerol-3-phosphate acyltransferase [Betaproteobacteria bacterium]
MRSALAVWRLGFAVVHLLHGTLICLVIFPFLARPKRMQRVGWWSARMLRLLGVTLRPVGAPQLTATLLVANHISWLDILAINAVHPARFVSKADVRAWPLLGWLIECAGTLFIERERKRDALRVVHQVAQALQSGDTIAVFPEGTTSDGQGLLPFHANLLQAAIATASPVQPIALRFSDCDHRVSPAAAYVGDTSLLQSVWWIVTARGLVAHVAWLPAQMSAHLDRRALAQRLRGDIALALDVTESREAA